MPFKDKDEYIAYQQEYQRTWHELHKEAANLRVNFARIERRRELLYILGGVCNCDNTDCWHEGHCTVSDERIMHFDHINGGGGRDHHALGGRFVHYYTNHPAEATAVLQVLCANCNWVKQLREKEYLKVSRMQLPIIRKLPRIG